MITLYQFPALFGVRNPSVFCLKVETYLNMIDLPFQIETVLDPRKAPLGKLPYIQDESEDKVRVIHDSNLIIAYLHERYNISLDTWLSQEDRAQGQLLSRALENHYYWAIVYSRFAGDNWPLVRQELSGLFSHVVRYVVPTLMQVQAKSALKAHGLGRHTPRDIYDMANADMTSVAMALGDKDYLFGDKPSSHDATLYAMIHNVLRSRFDSPLKNLVEESSLLTNYERRIRELYFEPQDDHSR
ncbi:glutathione S-transferase family protein [Allohahella marinimesophila]|uniref:Glutathione S-transferase C-terminal domain-containing protein n=1 Tax=Allohahella marinimesophila TaxID=1054972 RepID=A0ABP7PAR7_9GAMM